MIKQICARLRNIFRDLVVRRYGYVSEFAGVSSHASTPVHNCVPLALALAHGTLEKRASCCCSGAAPGISTACFFLPDAVGGRMSGLALEGRGVLLPALLLPKAGVVGRIWENEEEEQ